MTIRKRVCIQCGKELTGRQQKYCSRRCQWLVARRAVASAYDKEFRKDLRYAFRHGALNRFGKKISELTTVETQTVLRDIHRSYYAYFYPRKDMNKTDAYNALFRATFAGELRMIGRSHKP